MFAFSQTSWHNLLMCILIVFTLVYAVSKSQIQSISDVSDWDPWSIPSASNNLILQFTLRPPGDTYATAIYFCMLLAIERSASNVQPALINMNQLDLGNSRIRNSVSSHSAAASGTEEEPSRRHSGTRYRTPPPRTPPLPGFVTRQAFVGTLQMNDTCFMDLPPTEKRPTFTHSTRHHLLCIKW